MAKDRTEIVKQYYTWQEFDEDIEEIVRWAKERNFTPLEAPSYYGFQVKNKVYPSKKKLLTGFKSVYGIPRGGLILGVAISHRLGLPLKLKIEELDRETLVVDDIADSGRTLENLDKVLNFKPVVAVLFYHEDIRRKPDFYIREKKDWVVFPWETEKSSRYDSKFS